MTNTDRTLAGELRAQAVDLRNCDALPRQHRDTQHEIDAAADLMDRAAAALTPTVSAHASEGWRDAVIEKLAGVAVSLNDWDGEGWSIARRYADELADVIELIRAPTPPNTETFEGETSYAK
jgi:hypothetical protein